MKLNKIILITATSLLALGTTCANAYCWNTINQYGRVILHCTNGPGTGPNGPRPYWHGPYGPGPYYGPYHYPYYYRPGPGPYYGPYRYPHGPWHGNCWTTANGGRVCN